MLSEQEIANRVSSQNIALAPEEAAVIYFYAKLWKLLFITCSLSEFSSCEFYQSVQGSCLREHNPGKKFEAVLDLY